MLFHQDFWWMRFTSIQLLCLNCESSHKGHQNWVNGFGVMFIGLTFVIDVGKQQLTDFYFMDV